MTRQCPQVEIIELKDKNAELARKVELLEGHVRRLIDLSKKGRGKNGK